MFNSKNTKKQGDIGLGNAIAYFTQNHYTVCIPLTDSQDYDLVVDNGNGLKTVQVKTTNYKNKSGNFEVGLRITGGNSGRVLKKFDTNNCDLLFILCSDYSQYLIPRGEIVNSTTITLGKLYKKFNVCMTAIGRLCEAVNFVPSGKQ